MTTDIYWIISLDDNKYLSSNWVISCHDKWVEI